MVVMGDSIQSELRTLENLFSRVRLKELETMAQAVAPLQPL